MNLSRVFALSLAASLTLGCQSQSSDELKTDYNSAGTYAEGVPGGSLTEVEELQATVTAIDPVKRTFTLKDELGNSRTFAAPAEMHNFDQLKVGDQVKAIIGLERIVYLREPGVAAEDGAAGVMATAPLGDKPGLMMADTVELTAMIKGMDTIKRTATLQLPDGSQRTIKVRPDVEMKDEYLGRELVLRITSAVAISVEPK